MTDLPDSCCPPASGNAGENAGEIAGERTDGTERGVGADSGQRRVPDHALRIPGGRAYVGTDRPELADDGEGPVRRVRV
ncbi:MAG: hypothetical protein ACPH8C_05195, partial [Candidatus Puniceispirillaceae bacterium]